MTAQNFMNVVRFKLKSDCVDKYFQVIDKTSFEGMTQRYIAKTGDYDYCFVGIWKSAEAIAAQRLLFVFLLPYELEPKNSFKSISCFII